MVVAHIEEHHIRRRIQITQGAIDIDGVAAERNRHALRQHHLHDITGNNVVLDAFNGCLKILAREMVFEVVNGDFRGLARSWQRRWLFQCLGQHIETLLCLVESIRRRRIDIKDKRDRAAQVVKNNNLF